MLGYDVDESEAGQLLRRLADARADLPADDPRLLAGETEILRIFADLSALSRNRRVPDEADTDEEAAVDAEAARNPQEYFYAYLRSRDADTENLPESFRIRLRRALAHYGVTDLEPSPELEPALYRMFLAHRRAAAHAPVVSQLLRWRLRDPQSLPEQARDGYRQVIDQLVSATQLRHPAVGDLARQVRYRCFDAPLVAAGAGAGAAAGARGTRPTSPPTPRPGRLRSTPMVASGEPILGVFAERHHAVMLEVMTRRYYQIRPLRRVRVTERGGRPVLTAEYDPRRARLRGDRDRGQRRGHRRRDRPARAGGHAARPTGPCWSISTSPPRRPRTRAGTTRTPAPGGSATSSGSSRAPSNGSRSRCAGPTAEDEPAWFTFRGAPETGAAEEDRTQRGMHPMVAERLGLWRLSGFELTRLPAATDVHLFRAQGREVPEDQRLSPSPTSAT